MIVRNGLVSIIMPSYNCASFLAQAIESVLSQSYPHWELLIVDNNSTDNTQEVVTGYDDSRISFFATENNGIIAASRNLGIKHSRGEWLAFLDADDYWESTKIESCLQMGRQGYDVIYHPMVILRSKHDYFSRKLTKSWQVSTPVFRDLLVRGNPIINSSVFVSKKVIQKAGFISEDKDLVTAEDYNTWLALSQITEKFYCIKTCLGTYRIHNSNMSESVDRTIPLENVLNKYLQRVPVSDRRKAKALLAYIKGKANYKNNEFTLTIKYLKAAVHHLDISFLFPCVMLIIFALLKLFLTTRYK